MVGLFYGTGMLELRYIKGSDDRISSRVRNLHMQLISEMAFLVVLSPTFDRSTIAIAIVFKIPHHQIRHWYCWHPLG